jgi:metallophosphoesterase (TIGR03767 family)
MHKAFRTRGRAALVVAGLAAASVGGVSSAQADPAGKTTLSETIPLPAGSGFGLLQGGKGEGFVVRQGALGKGKRARAKRRRSLVFFGQFTDPQIGDEMTPVKFDFLDEIGSPVQDGNRPQEAFEMQTFDQTIRNMNANKTSAVRAKGGKRAKLQFALNTGDMADNQQLNEVRGVIQLLDGGTIDPFAGDPVTDQCGNLPAETIARLNADVAARRYTGLQDYDDYRDAPAIRQQPYWDPDEAPPGGAGPFADWPRYPGLLDRAQQPFDAQGVQVPWYTARGNHDGEITGNLPATFALARTLSTACQKVFPGEALDPNTLKGKSDSEIAAEFSNPDFVNKALSQLRPVPPDSDRRFVPTEEYKQLHNTGDHSHGYGYVDKKELKASNGAAPYYAFSPRKGFRFISLDTVSDGGSQRGNIDNPQYKWLQRELDKNSSTEFKGRKLKHDKDKDRLIVLYGHHPLESMSSTATDESAGECKGPVDPGCDRDPRKSTPIHQGLKGKNSLLSLLQRYPNVIALVVGHSHENHITARARSDRKSGFWEINTASHVDWPQQSRQIEVLDNRDGTLSIFGTLLDQAAPITAPAFGTPATAFSSTELASISRLAAANDYQGKGNGNGEPGLGKRTDRNVEMVIRNPAKLRKRK